jgi:hypothetical protein
MKIDQKILEECGKAVISKNCDDSDGYNKMSDRQKDILKSGIQAAIETYERLKPSPWRPIEDVPDGIYFISYPKHHFREDEKDTIELTPFDHAIFMVEITNNVWNEPPEIYETSRYFDDDFCYGDPTHFMPIPKMTEGE